jgi:hypothetical protein
MEDEYILAAIAAQFPRWVATTGEYIRRTYEVVAVEQEFAFSLKNPETGGESRSFVEAGKIDLLLRHKTTGLISVGEHKTTAGDIAPGSDYWPALKMDTQISKYVIASQVLHPESGIGPIFYDVTRKPGCRPAGVPLTDEAGVKIVHDAEGVRQRTKDGKKWRESGDTAQGFTLQTRPETAEEYGDRVAEVMRAEPAKYFQAREIPRLANDLEEYMADSWAVGQQLLYARQKNLWPRNPSHCDAWSRCQFWEKCAGTVPADSDLYATVPQAHAELNMQDDGSGRQLLTNSRMKAYRCCPRLHYHLYENPIRRVGEEAEALRWGTLWHHRLEAWLTALIVPVTGSTNQPELTLK